MAYLRQRNGIYAVCFRWGGNQIVRSLDERNENRANALLERLELQLKAVKDGLATIPTDADPIEWLMTGGKRKAAPDLTNQIRTVGQLIDRYLAAMPEGSHAKTTKRIDAIRFKHLKRLLGERTALQTITVETLQGYMKERAKESATATTPRQGQPKKRRASRAKAQPTTRTVGPSTIKKELATLRTAWIWAADCGAPPPPRFAKLKYAKEPEKEVFRHAEEIREILKSDPKADAEAMWECLVLTLDEVRELVAFVQEHWKHHQWFVDAFTIAAYTGARRSELCRMKAEDVDLKRGEITIRDKKRVRDKSEGKRVVFIAEDLEPTLTRLKERGGLLIQYKGFEEEQLATALSNQWINAQPKDSPWKHCRGFHVLRHSFASNLAASGEVEQPLIDSYMGHQTEEMRRRYRHFFPSEKKKARDVFSRKSH